jgi:flagellar L-ring protein precursor FlgH
MRKIFLLALAAVLAMPIARASADSLWSDGSSLFSDRKASGVGDIVLVKVTESFSDTDQGKTSSTKDSDEDIRAGSGILSFIKAFGFGTSTSMNGNTKVERTKKMNMQVSCLVTEVMPNGNLVIQGERSMVNGAERMNVRYSGVVRPQDIAHNNVVESSRVANAELICNGKGVITRTQRPGIINQILQAIF